MILRERRSGIDTRSDAEKQLIGERRSGIDRRSGCEPAKVMPSNEQLALFARRLRRTIRDEKGRNFFGVANGEQDFALYPDVLRVAEWIEGLASSDKDHQIADRPNPSLRRAVASNSAAVPPRPSDSSAAD
jgi:hypothetical protein